MFGFWHTYNRGVEKRKIFLNQEDYFRGVHDIYEFNDKNAVINTKQRLTVIKGYPIPLNQIPLNQINQKPRDLLVDLFTWCLMPNHFHLFSCPKNKDSLAKFHQKIGIGYTNYFNLKYERQVVLFQGKYKKVQVLSDAQSAHLVCYIHSNLLDLWKHDWKIKKLTNLELQNALEFLKDKKNRWSSHQDYWGIKNFPSLINTDFIFKFFKGPKNYQQFFIDWLKQYQKNIENLPTILTLERK